jgi:S1-C subfamily serine protease
MKLAISALVLLIATAAFAGQQEIAATLDAQSITIKAGGSQGSGVVITRNMGKDKVHFIWTAAHVVRGLRSERAVIDPKTGTKRIIVEFDKVGLLRFLTQDGQRVGQIEMDAKVIRYSDADNGHDLALLRVSQKNNADFSKVNAVFYLDKKIPTIGTSLMHCGSLHGADGANSITAGLVSAIARDIGLKVVFDQTSCPAFPGSSGGGVYIQATGQYMGMLVRGAGETFNLVVPVRRMRRWAKDAGIMWALDPKIKMPTEDELKKMPIEDIGVGGAAKKDPKSVTKENPFMIWREHGTKARSSSGTNGG